MSRLILVCVFAACGQTAATVDDLTGAALKRQIVSDTYKKPAGDAIKVAFFDADSTLRVSISGSVSANGPRDVVLLPMVPETLARVAAEGYLIHIVSNQGGVGSAVSLQDADAALDYTRQLIREGGGEVHSFDFAELKDEYRKPQPGMGNRLERILKEKFSSTVYIDKAASFMVGDSSWKEGETRPDGRAGFSFSNADRLFAENYGVAFHEPQDFFGWVTYGIDEFENKAQLDAFLMLHPSTH